MQQIKEAEQNREDLSGAKSKKRKAEEPKEKQIKHGRTDSVESSASKQGKEEEIDKEEPQPPQQQLQVQPQLQPQLQPVPFWDDLSQKISEWIVLPKTVVQKRSSKELPKGKKPWYTIEEKQFKSDSKPVKVDWKKVVQLMHNAAKKDEEEKEKSKNKKKRPKKKRKKPEAGKAKKIKLRLTANQKDTLKQWMGTARWTYNQCLNEIKTKNLSINADTKKLLRERFIYNDNYKTTNQWVLNTPQYIRDQALSDLMGAFKSNFASGHQFQIKFRSKKSPQEAIALEGRKWKDGRIYPRSFGKAKMKAFEVLPSEMAFDFRIVKNRLSEFFICIPHELEIRSESQAPTFNNFEEGILSIDPGVRTFCTGYSPNGKSCEWAKNDIARIGRLCHALDKLQSKWSQPEIRHRKRYRLRRAATRIRKKIRNIVDDVHKRLCNWLVHNYHTILLPEFRTQGMVQKGKRKITSKTARNMLTWAHYRFRMRLLNKAREFPWCKVIVCDEAYTSKTCGKCGTLHNKLGGNKVFACPHCKVTLDRDINGARNILIRYLTLKCSKSLRALGLTPLL